MMTTGERPETSAPSPAARSRPLNNRWHVGERYAIRGDLHLHKGTGEVDAHIAVWRYRGSEPLPRFLDHLKRDADAWGAIRHGNLSSTLDIGRVTGEMTCFWIQEASDALSLAERLEAHPTLAPDAALHIALQIGHALIEVHRGGLVHGDLDPANIHLLGNNDRVRLSWGGLAHRIETAGMDAGRGTSRSLSELAPEILASAPFDARSDLYGLSALIYRMIAGKPPFLVRRRGPPPGLDSTEHLDALPEYVDPALRAALTEGLQRDPARRPAFEPFVSTLIDIERRLRGNATPSGSWAPPPIRTSTPSLARHAAGPPEVDDILANTPSSVPSTTGLPITRSVVPMAPRGAFPTVTPARAPTPMSTEPRIASEPTVLNDSLPGSHEPRPARLGAPTVLTTLAAAGVMALLVLGGVAALAVWFGPEAPPVAARPPAPIPAPVEPAPVAPPTANITLTLRSKPQAEVFEGGEQIGHTPVTLSLSPDPGGYPRTFTLKQPGFVDQTYVQEWTETSTEEFFTLTPEEAVSTVQPRPRPRTEPRPPPRDTTPRVQPKPPAPPLRIER